MLLGEKKIVETFRTKIGNFTYITITRYERKSKFQKWKNVETNYILYNEKKELVPLLALRKIRELETGGYTIATYKVNQVKNYTDVNEMNQKKITKTNLRKIYDAYIETLNKQIHDVSTEFLEYADFHYD